MRNFPTAKQEAKKKKSRTVPKIKSQHRMAARERSLMQTPSAGMTINRILLINPTKNTKFAHAVLGCARKYTRISHCGRSADMQQALAHKQQEGGSEKRELIISLILAAASHLSRWQTDSVQLSEEMAQHWTSSSTPKNADIFMCDIKVHLWTISACAHVPGGITATCPGRMLKSSWWHEMNRTPSWSESRCPNLATLSCPSWRVRGTKMEPGGFPTSR